METRYPRKKGLSLQISHRCRQLADGKMEAAKSARKGKSVVGSKKSVDTSKDKDTTSHDKESTQVCVIHQIRQIFKCCRMPSKISASSRFLQQGQGFYKVLTHRHREQSKSLMKALPTLALQLPLTDDEEDPFHLNLRGEKKTTWSLQQMKLPLMICCVVKTLNQWRTGQQILQQNLGTERRQDQPQQKSWRL